MGLPGAYTEYAAADAQGNYLLISCPDDTEESDPSVSFTVMDRSYEDFVLIIDGETLDGFQNAASRAGADNFKYTYEKLRRAKSIQVLIQNRHLFSLPAKGSSKALPAVDAPNFACSTGW